jgi:hypothetical protein
MTLAIEPYDFRFVSGANNSYLFDTDYGIGYEIKFVPSGYLWESNPHFKDFTFDFVIAVVVNNTGKTPPLDKRLPDTVSVIFNDFFRDKRNMAVYICDSSDNKQAIRFRKFNNWFNLFKGIRFMKIDMTIQDVKEIVIYTSLIMRMDNPNKDEISLEFYKISEESEQNK